MASLIRRLMLRYNLGQETCPNATLRQSMSSLRYLVHKKYEENTIGKFLY